MHQLHLLDGNCRFTAVSRKALLAGNIGFVLSRHNQIGDCKLFMIPALLGKEDRLPLLEAATG